MMRSTGLLHPALLELVARSGHGDVIVLADAGLKIPVGAHRIDLALSAGVPSMTQVLDAVLPALVVEGATIPEEMASWSPELEELILARLPFEPRRIPHAEFAAEMAAGTLAYVKTGECTAYASVALVCGVSYLDEAVAHRDQLERERRGRAQPAIEPT